MPTALVRDMTQRAATAMQMTIGRMDQGMDLRHQTERRSRTVTVGMLDGAMTCPAIPITGLLRHRTDDAHPAIIT